jgi:hypothetical protein
MQQETEYQEGAGTPPEGPPPQPPEGEAAPASPIVTPLAGVVVRKSALITARDAFPQIPVDLRKAGRSFEKREIVTLVSGDSIASTLIFFSLASNAVVVSLKVSLATLGTTTAGNVGLYDTTVNGGAAVSASFFAAALNLHTALNKGEQLFGGGGVITPANAMQMIWQQLGLASDPGKDYDVVITLTGAADGGGAILVECGYKMV